MSSGSGRALKNFKRDWQIYVLVMPTVVYIILFCYVPMYGVQIAFRDYYGSRGMMGSPWVGLKHFRDFFASYYWKRIIVNTIVLNVYSLALSFPVPIVLALMLNKVRSKNFKSAIQTVVYIPHFISVVVLAGMLYIYLSPVSGIINKFIEAAGGRAIYFMNDPKWFRAVYIISGIWQNAGWSTILYIAALTAIDPQLYESATIDGANQWQKIVHIDIPGMIPIIATVLIMNMGNLFSSEFQKTYLLQTPGNMSVSDTIGVYVYTAGLLGAQFSYTAAIGLMQNVINFFILLLVNKIAQKTGENSLW